MEKVYNVRYDPLRTHLIALVATGGNKRWTIASEHMKPGDYIKTINVLPNNPIKGEEGNAYPIGALIPGTIVHNIEKQPGDTNDEFRFCIAAGTHATIHRRLGDTVTIKLTNGREITLNERCMVTVGKVSNPNHYTVNILVPQRLRWKGIRPASGLWHRKDGYCGFKNRKPKPLILTELKPKKVKTEYQALHLLND